MTPNNEIVFVQYLFYEFAPCWYTVKGRSVLNEHQFRQLSASSGEDDHVAKNVTVCWSCGVAVRCMCSAVELDSDLKKNGMVTENTQQGAMAHDNGVCLYTRADNGSSPGTFSISNLKIYTCFLKLFKHLFIRHEIDV